MPLSTSGGWTSLCKLRNMGEYALWWVLDGNHRVAYGESHSSPQLLPTASTKREVTQLPACAGTLHEVSSRKLAQHLQHSRL